MNRTQRFSRSIFSGYACTFVVAACSFASIYLSLRFLSVPQFGLWALVFQINGYLLLTDFGISNAVGRFLMDWKDQRPSKQYGETFIAGLLILFFQAALLFSLSLAVVFWAPGLLKIPQELIPSFRFLVFGQALISAVFFPLRVFSFALVAYGRFDWINASAATGQLASLGGFAWGLQHGWSLPSYLFGSLLDALFATLVIIIANQRLQLLPKASEAIRPGWDCCFTIFRYGRDMFLILFGNRILFASQAIILARFAGLEAVAAWAVGSKMFFFCRDFSNQIAQASGPLLVEIYAKGNFILASKKLQDLTLLSGSFATVLGSFLIVGNRPFVSLWTKGLIQWETCLDVVLALILMINCLFAVLCHVTGMTKDLTIIRWVGLKESLLFLLFACFLVRLLGIFGMVLAHFFAACLISVPFLIYAVQKFNQRHNSVIRIAPSALIRWALVLFSSYFLSSIFIQMLNFQFLLIAFVLLMCIFVFLLAPLHWEIVSPFFKSRLHYLPKPLQRFFLSF
jgi:O-antigen/teichoic acid export membrane protein